MGPTAKDSTAAENMSSETLGHHATSALPLHNPFADRTLDNIDEGGRPKADAPGLPPVEKPPSQEKIDGAWSFQASRLAAQQLFLRSKSRAGQHPPKGASQPKEASRPKIFVNTDISRLHGRALTLRGQSRHANLRLQENRLPQEPSPRSDGQSNAAKALLSRLKEVDRSVPAGPPVGERGPHTVQLTGHRKKDALSHTIDSLTLSPNTMAVRLAFEDDKLFDSLSPSDRAILIAISPRTASKTTGPNELCLSLDDTMTPTVHISPVQGANGPFADPPSTPLPSKSRIASTTSSRPFSLSTPFLKYYTERRHQRDSCATHFHNRSLPYLSKRNSTATVSEDDNPSPLVKSATSASQPRSESSHRRSRGWWNYITSPFLTRSNTSASSPRSPLPREHPQLPNLVEAGAIVGLQSEGNKGFWGSLRSPMIPPQSLQESPPLPATQSPKDSEKRGSFYDPSPTPSARTSLNGEPPLPGPQAVKPLQNLSDKWHSFLGPSLPEPDDPKHRDLGGPQGAPPAADAATMATHPSDERRSVHSSVHSSSTESGSTDVDDDPRVTIHLANSAVLLRACAPVSTRPPPFSSRPMVADRSPSSPDYPTSDPPPYSPPPPGLRYGPSIPPHTIRPADDFREIPLGPVLPHAAAPTSRPPASDTQAMRFLHESHPSRRSAPRPPRLDTTFLAMGSATARPFMAGPNREAERRRGEREDAAAREVGSWWRGRGCFGQKARFQKGGREARHRRRCWVGVMLAALLVLIALVTALAVGLRPKTKRAIPTEASPWVNITGWPPLPTGVSSIVRPDAVKANSGCVFPSTMWSCSLPKEVQGGSGAAPADQPEFRFEIRYPSNTTSSPPASDTSSVFPEPPSVEEQQFMGNTTDGIASPLKEGEASPFFMALLSNPVSSSSSSPRRKRSHDTPRTKRDDGSFPVPLLGIPPPDIDADGSVKAANLLPLSVSQRLRLYDRGLDSEHYGFYIYYDRSIFLQSTALLNQSDRGQGSVPADRDGGSPARDARVRCTWAQTRFLVQVWTRMNQTRVEGNEPASFVYPATITLDRHGGDVTKKLIYCYGLDPAAPTHIVPRAVKIQVENRGFGGQLVGGGQGPLGKDRVTRAQGGLGGIDGGTGGCACAWKNFRG